MANFCGPWFDTRHLHFFMGLQVARHQRMMGYYYGGLSEWLIEAVLKTAVLERVPGVRIPHPPLK